MDSCCNPNLDPLILEKVAQPLKWSPRLKNAELEISGKTITRNDGAWRNRYGYLGVCGLTNNLIDVIDHNGKSKWAIQIKKLENWMYIGIC